MTKRKTEFLQIRVTREQKATLKQRAKSAGQGMSAFVLERLMPVQSERFHDLMSALVHGEESSYAIAELNDLLSNLSSVEWSEAVSEPPPAALSPYLANYVAAMVEQAAEAKGVAPPAWVAEIEPLKEPHFATTLSGLRLHLLAQSPVPFRRRNLFIDSAIGARV